MEIIWAAWFFGGLIMGFTCCHLAYMGTEVKDDDGNNKESYDGDDDIRIYHPSSDREHRSVGRYSEDEMIMVMNNVKQLTYGYERAVMQSIIDKLERRQKDEQNDVDGESHR